MAKKSDTISLHDGPFKFAADDESFSFKYKGFKAEGDFDSDGVAGMLKLRGDKIGFEGDVDTTFPTYGFDGSFGKIDVFVEANIETGQVAIGRFELDL